MYSLAWLNKDDQFIKYILIHENVFDSEFSLALNNKNIEKYFRWWNP